MDRRAGGPVNHCVAIVHKLDRFARNRRVAFDAFHKLGTAGVGFVSIAENMDYSTPAGQLMLTMLVGMAQFYSDNLSAETKKGKHERKRQGLYNGLLPFGTTKGPHGLPILDRGVRYCDVATRSDFAAVVEDQIGAMLARFAVPEADRRARRRLGARPPAVNRRERRARPARAQAGPAAGRAPRRRPRPGHLPGPAGRAERGACRAAGRGGARRRDGEAARRLADIAGAWQVAMPAERNKLARHLFVEAIVENRTAVAVLPRPDVRPFFETLACQAPDETTRWRKRRGSVAPLRR